MTVKLLTEHHLEFLSLTGGCIWVYSCQNTTYGTVYIFGSPLSVAAAAAAAAAADDDDDDDDEASMNGLFIVSMVFVLNENVLSFDDVIMRNTNFVAFELQIKGTDQPAH